MIKAYVGKFFWPGFMLGLAFVGFCWACGRAPQSGVESGTPAKVENAVEEAALATVTLSPKAEERLGIETSEVLNQILPASLKFGGEIVSLPGRDVRVAAPAAGKVLRTGTGDIPPAGKFVNKGQEVMRLLLLPPEQDLLGAREEWVVKQEECEVARAKADRAEQLLAIKAISEKVYQETRVELARAEASLKAAAALVDLLSGADLDVKVDRLSTLVLRSPVDGFLRRISVAAGQTVPAATALFEVAEVDRIWVRVPVYVDDLPDIDLKQEAAVMPLGEDRPSALVKAKPVSGPPLSDPESVSSDLYYGLSNEGRRFRIGQKVGVSLVRKVPEECLVIPWSAILYDIHGGNWVYMKSAPYVYSRRRVEVSHFVGDLAVLTRGLNAGDEVVVAGAAEIFGTEFGVGK